MWAQLDVTHFHERNRWWRQQQQCERKRNKIYFRSSGFYAQSEGVCIYSDERWARTNDVEIYISVITIQKALTHVPWHGFRRVESSQACVYVCWGGGLKSSNIFFSEFSCFTIPHHRIIEWPKPQQSQKYLQLTDRNESGEIFVTFRLTFSTWWETKRAHEQFNQLSMLLVFRFSSSTWGISSLSLSTHIQVLGNLTRLAGWVLDNS